MAKLVTKKPNKNFTWFDIISDAEVRQVNGKTKVFLNTGSSNKPDYRELKSIHVSTLRSLLHRYNLSNPENYVEEKNISKVEIIPTLRRLIIDDTEAYKSYVQRVEKATGKSYESFSPRDIERANRLFEYLKRHPEDPLKNEKWESEGIIRELWNLATDEKVKFDKLASSMENWLIEHGSNPDFYRYDENEQEEILEQMSRDYEDENDYFDFSYTGFGQVEGGEGTLEEVFGR